MPFLGVGYWGNLVLTIEDRHAVFEAHILRVHSDMMILLLAGCDNRVMMASSAAGLENILLVLSDGHQVLRVESYSGYRLFGDRQSRYGDLETLRLVIVTDAHLHGQSNVLDSGAANRVPNVNDRVVDRHDVFAMPPKASVDIELHAHGRLLDFSVNVVELQRP